MAENKLEQPRSKSLDELAELFDASDFGEAWETMPEAHFDIDIKKNRQMIILHDGVSGGDLTHIQAIADIKEGFAQFDYVRIEQVDGKSWIGQIVQPNQNISTVGSRLDPTILHGLKLMQEHSNVQSVESVQVFDIKLLGQFDGMQMSTLRLRPLPGAFVSKLNAEDTCQVIEIPTLQQNATSNVVGELLNADNVPLCIKVDKKMDMFNYHIMVAGGTGSGKSNAAANLVDQALRVDKCVLIHDAKPDYGLINLPNTDRQVETVWERFAKYNLRPHPASDIIRIGFNGKCDPDKIDDSVAFHASYFSPEMLAGFFFTGSSPAEQNAYEGFAGAADALYQQIQEGARSTYSLDDILKEVERRNSPNTDPREVIHELTAKSILRKVNARRKGMKWLDTVGQPSGKKTLTGQQGSSRLQSSALNGNQTVKVKAFDLERYVKQGRVIVIDYSQMDEQSYALFLSYFLRVCQQYRKQRKPTAIVQLVDEAHRVFDNESRHSKTLERAFERVMREGRSVDHSIIMSLQNASQIPQRVMNNLNSKVVMRQNSKAEADAATQTMGKEFSEQAMRLGTGHALVSLYEARATVLAQMAPSPFELMRNDNTSRDQQSISEEDDYDF